MRWKQADFLAGSFVLAGFALILAIIIVVRGQIGAPDSYHTYFKNVAGLRAGAAVVYEGYIVGAVAEVEPEAGDAGMRFRVNLEVEKDWVILRKRCRMAVSLLSTTPSSCCNCALARTVRSIITAINVMSEISKTADELTEIAQTHVAPLLTTLRDVLDVEGRGALASVSTLSGALAEEAPQIAANIEDATANVADVTSANRFHPPHHRQCRTGVEGRGGDRRYARRLHRVS